MASCLVPEFPAVMVALEHLKELDKQLREEGIPFSPEASLHLTEITTAITELEADRCATHEHLEVETIQNSNLRHQIINTRERMSQEIMADVAAARASNAEEIEQLHKDLNTVSQLQEATAKRQEVLQSQNKALLPERDQMKAEHEELVAVQNDQITSKYGLQMQLDQTQDQTEELKSCIAAVQQDKITLQQKMVLEREAFVVKKDNLFTEVDQVVEKIKQQKQLSWSSRSELDSLNDKRRKAHERLGQLTIDLDKLESSLRSLAESRYQCEKQLQGETQKHQELRQQREILQRELRELGESFSAAILCLTEEIERVEGKIEEGRASRLLCLDYMAQTYEVFKCRRNEENRERAEHFHVTWQLEQSKLRLLERIASVVKHRTETKKMDMQIRELLETDKVTKRMLDRNQEDLCDNVAAEKKNVGDIAEEKMRLMKLLEEAQSKQKEHMAKMISAISSARRRYQELQQEQATLLKHLPESANADLLMSYVTQCEVQYRQKEIQRREEEQQVSAEVASITRRYKEKQREVEEKEVMLKEVEAKVNEEQSRQQRLKTLTSELRRKRDGLELSIQELKEKTGSLLQPKEEKKAELEDMRGGYMNVLDKQASELRAVEISIYDNRVILEQVNMENSRLQLCIRQMTEDAGTEREYKERYWQETRQFERDIKALLESLQEAWREDSLVTQDCQHSDGVLLLSMSAMLDRLKTRRQQLGKVTTLLHKLMLDFSKRLGDKSMTVQQS